MLADVFNTFLHGFLFFSLFLIDYALGNGFVDIFQKILCKIICFIRKTLREDEKQINAEENNINVSVLFSEIMFLFLTILVLNKYKQYRGKDRIDELLQDSRDALRQTNEFLEKWRLRRLNYHSLSEHSYLDDEPQKLEPLKLEVPILHMAIIDTMGTSRTQPESGDAGDPINIMDTTLLSVTSLLEDDLDTVGENLSDVMLNESKIIDYRNRYLWDVMEEDVNNLEEYERNGF